MSLAKSKAKRGSGIERAATVVHPCSFHRPERRCLSFFVGVVAGSASGIRHRNGGDISAPLAQFRTRFTATSVYPPSTMDAVR